MPRQFPAMVLAEIRKVYTRGSGVAALFLALVIGLGAVGGFLWLQSMGEGGPSLNGTPLSQIVDASGVDIAGRALQARNFFLLPLFLLLAAASSMAGELGDRTLRELVVRPVPRWSVLAAKLLALSILSLSTLALTLVSSLGLGAAFFGLHGEAGPTVTDLLAGYGASFASDVGLLVLATAASMLLSSVGGVVVAVVLLLMVDTGFGLLLQLLGAFGIEQATRLIPWTLGNALGCWKGWKDGWDAAQFGSLSAFVVVLLAFAIARFHRMDVP